MEWTENEVKRKRGKVGCEWKGEMERGKGRCCEGVEWKENEGERMGRGRERK